MIMIDFSIRLKTLRIEKRLKQQEVASAVGLSLPGYRCYEQGRCFPEVPKLCKLADFFDVNIDYLLGRCETRNKQPERKGPPGMELKLKPLSPKIGREIPVPAYATPGAAAMDLHACIDVPTAIPARGGRAPIPTGLALAIPEGYVGLIFARSGLASKFGVAPANCVGVIDSDYRGEIIVPLQNSGESDYTVRPGDRIAQLMLTPAIQAQIKVVDELDGTARGTGGFGSTGT